MSELSQNKAETFLILLSTGLCRTNYTGNTSCSSLKCWTKHRPFEDAQPTLQGKKHLFPGRNWMFSLLPHRGGCLLLNVLLCATEISFQLRMKGERLQYPIRITSLLPVGVLQDSDRVRIRPSICVLLVLVPSGSIYPISGVKANHKFSTSLYLVATSGLGRPPLQSSNFVVA